MSDPIETQIRWLGLCLRSESDRPHEWPYIAWAVRNRVLSKYRGKEAYQEVILDRKQFSYFNQFASLLLSEDPNALYAAAAKGYAGDATGWAEDNLSAAEDCARAILLAPRYTAPFDKDVRHYYSPVSMKPVGSAPPWAATARLLFTPSGVDPRRFVFGAGVA